MNEQIIITRNNEGIEIEVQFINNKKKAVDITGCTVEVTFKNPLMKLDHQQAYIKDYKNGTCGIILDKTTTGVNGLWTTYWSAIDGDGFVTAQESIYYFVLPRYGGVDND